MFILQYGRILASMLMPVIIALIFTLLLMPLVDRLEQVFRSRLVSSLVVSGFFVLLVSWAVAAGFGRLYREALSLSRDIPQLWQLAESVIVERLLPLFQGTPYEQTVYDLLNQVLAGGFQFLNDAAAWLIRSAALLPTLFVGIMVGVLLTFYLLYEKTWVLKAVPWANDDNIEKVLRSVHGFIRVQFFLITVTAVIAMLVFLLLGIPYVLALGLILALLDLLPILGAGALMIPMAIWYLAAGETFKGIVIAILYIVIVAVRQIIQPRLLSSNLNIHPIVAILALFLGLQLFGILGLILLPLVASILATFPRFAWLKRRY
jgi:sporulation integral membrane protein YtvI